MTFKKTFLANFQLFADGGTSASQGNAGSAESVSLAMTENGSSDGQAAGAQPENEGVDREKSYADMKKQFKDLYDKDVQSQIKRRLGNTKAIEKELSAYKSLADKLSLRYKTNDIEALSKALDEDDSYWENAAYESGMSVEQFKEHTRIQEQARRDNAELEMLRAREKAREQYSAWFEEAKAVKEAYPEFDLNTCLKDNRFKSMLMVKNKEYMPSMKEIYEMLNHEQLLKATKEQAKNDIVNNVKARGVRPGEAGATTSAGISVSTDVSRLTRQQRAELARKASMGENITF